MTKEKNDMAKEYKINKGDRVRFVGDYDHYVEDVLKKDAEYTVVDADMCGCDLAVQCTAYSVSGKDLELVEPYDRRTAFLTRLQSLLREFDAHIEPCGCEVEGLSIVLKDNEEIYYKMDDFSPMRNLTADNIMDFDKEEI